MTDLERLLHAIPALRELGPDRPYLRLNLADNGGESAVDADAEWGEGSDGALQLAVAVTERAGSQRQPVMAAVFHVASGDLVATGTTVSLAAATTDKPGREAALATLLEVLEGLTPLGPAT